MGHLSSYQPVCTLGICTVYFCTWIESYVSGMMLNRLTLLPLRSKKGFILIDSCDRKEKTEKLEAACLVQGLIVLQLRLKEQRSWGYHASETKIDPQQPRPAQPSWTDAFREDAPLRTRGDEIVLYFVPLGPNVFLHTLEDWKKWDM